MNSKKLLLTCLAVILALFLIASPVLAAVPFVQSASNPVVWAQSAWEGYEASVSDGKVGAPCVMLEAGTYKMWYSSVNTNGNPRIGYATSGDGLIWNKVGEIMSGGNGNWDGYGVGSPSVIFDTTDNRYKMWYTAIANSPMRPSIGYATSLDGIGWTGFTQVMQAGIGWESWGVSLPSVIKDGVVFKMWYTGHTGYFPGQIGYATSANGTNWINRQSVLTGDTWDNGGVFGCSVKKVGSSYIMYYSGDASGGSFEPRIGRADSANGTFWNKSGDNPVLGAGSTGTWEEKGVAAPTFIIVNGNTEMWYTGADNDGVIKIGQASQTLPAVPANSNLGTVGLIAGLVVLIAGVSFWNLRKNRLQTG